MKSALLIAAAAIIVLANGMALVHASRNRGAVEAEITLTNRELMYHRDAENSGVDLYLSWSEGASPRDPRSPWLNREKLQALGFDVSEPASEAYRRQLARTAFAALEYNGPAWRAYVEASRVPAFPRSHLIAIDADLNPVALRTRHPDRHSVLIVPAVIGIAFSLDNRLSGNIRQISSVVHVPLPLSEGFRNLPERAPGALPADEETYRVTLRYGKLLEPWVAAVDFPAAR